LYGTGWSAYNSAVFAAAHYLFSDKLGKATATRVLFARRCHMGRGSGK
jgi:hypothetical protein